jgi:hypothetical protein
MGALATTDLPAYRLLRDRIAGALDLLQEGRSVDFKMAVEWVELKHGIPKDVLAMSNVRDGGIIIVGVEEIDNKWNLTGMTQEQLNTYDPDDMIDHVNRYASPSITVDVVKHAHNDGLNFLIIQVHEFVESPILCKRDYSGDLRRGAFYIRPLGKPESREVQNAEEMRDLLDLAAEKRTRNLLRQIERVGIDLATAPLQKTVSDKFDEELEGL